MSDLNNTVAAAVFNEGWTCTAHEPVGEWDSCPDCRESLTNLSGVVVSITLDAVRDAVEALDAKNPYGSTYFDCKEDAIAAIDALRGETK